MNGILVMSRDLKLLVTSNALRNFGYGMMEVLFVLYLTDIGFDAIRVGAFIAATLIGSALLNLTVGVFADRLGRRRLMALMTMIMILAGMVIIFSKNFIVILLAALSGALNFTAISTGAFVGLDQATMPQLSPMESRNRIFGVYNTAALLARMGGALASSVPKLLEGTAEITLVGGYRLTLGIFVVVGVISLACVGSLSSAIEVDRKKTGSSRKLFSLVRSRRTVMKISALFGVDAFTSGLVANSLIVLFFNQRFGVGAEVMGPVYSLARLLQAFSYQIAVRLADRIGLLKTMVFTHLPSQFLLMALPFAPSLSVGIGILLLRQGLAHMDLPTRQAYITTIVDPEERTAAAGITNLTRNLTQSISPTITGFAYQALVYTVPFLFAGMIGVLYDLGMYLSFRRVVPIGEETRLSDGRL
ncbi:MAG: MFS transporter [Anaerolineales bacterium]|nr:MAG: MFS transporter [Anaerolineales bacterium]